MEPLILASQSPRRRELLRLLTTAFEVRISEEEEHLPAEISPEDAVKHLALQKARAVTRQLTQEQNCGGDPLSTGEILSTGNALSTEEAPAVLGADTVVAIDGKILGKPQDAADAAQMLRTLSGREHLVHTGVALCQGKRERVFHESTAVTFAPLSEDEIAWYIRTGEPFDKAGGYGIQGLGARLVRKIDGDFFTVMGLPVASLYRELGEFCPFICMNL